MKHLENIDFSDDTFPIKIIPNRESFIGNVDSATRAFHEAVEIKYFCEGESTIIINSQTVHASAGDIIVVNPYEFHTTIDCGKETPGKYHLFMIGLDFFEGAVGADINLRKLLFEKRVCFKSKINGNERLARLLCDAVREYENRDNASRLSLFGLVAEIFAELLRNASAKDTTAPTEDRLGYYAIIEPALRLIRDGYSEKFTVDGLADSANTISAEFSRRQRGSAQSGILTRTDLKLPTLCCKIPRGRLARSQAFAALTT